MNKILLFSGGSSCCWYVGTPKTQRISVATACNEADKRVKVWNNTANPWRNEDLCEETQHFCATSGALTLLLYHPGSCSLGYMSKTCMLHTFQQIKTVGVTGTWPQHIALGLMSCFWTDWNIPADLTSLGPVLGAGGELTCPEGHHGGIPRLLTQRKINDSLYINTQIYLAFPCQLPFQGMQISVPKGWGIAEFPSPVEHQSSPSKLQQQLNHSSSPGISGSGGERVVTVPQHVRLGAP